MDRRHRLAAVGIATLLLAALPAGAGLPAFPGAEGFGASASGGRGKPVVYVTNLDDAGPGSLREALSAGDRTVMFKVSGTIGLRSALNVKGSNVTIAGESAPGEGICIRGRELMITNIENVIVRHLRLRPGDELGTEHDALSVRNSQHVIIDHCSMSWSTDSINDVTHGSGNITVQWCVLSEPLDRSVHSKGAHGYATGWDGRIRTVDGKTVGGGGSYHHNLIAHAHTRAPRLGYFREGRGLLDVRNNVIYNTGEGSAYGGETDDFNFVGNYFRPGPATKLPRVVFDIWADDSRGYVADNFVEGHPDVSADNRVGLTFRKGELRSFLLERPVATAPVTTEPAQAAYERVLASAGAVRPVRDAVDRRIVDDVRNRTGRIINSQRDVGGWPELRSAPAPTDTDGDGLPDDWEKARGLDPANPADGTATAKDGPGYTNLELYLHSLAAPRE